MSDDFAEQVIDIAPVTDAPSSEPSEKAEPRRRFRSLIHARKGLSEKQLAVLAANRARIQEQAKLRAAAKSSIAKQVDSEGVLKLALRHRLTPAIAAKIADSLLARAIAGSSWAMMLVWDRMEGRVAPQLAEQVTQQIAIKIERIG